MGPRPASGGPPLIVILALRQRNIGLLEDKARQVSDPTELSYGHYYSRDEVNSIAGPSDEDVATVREFLARTPGRAEFSKGRDLVRFICDVGCVEETFSTTLMTQRGRTKPGTSPYRAATPISLPAHVAAALDGVSLNAPIFMPQRPKLEPLLAFVYPASGRTAPRISPYLVPGDQFLTLRFVAYCKDGQANKNRLEEGLCSRGADGPSGHIVSFEIVVLQEPLFQKVVQLPATPEVLGQREGNCGRPCVEFNVTVGNIQNYANTTARIRSHFGDGSVSAFSDTAELPPVWPLPYTTPALLSKFYGIPLNRPIRHPRNIISVAEFLGQYYNPADLEAFNRLMGVRSWDTGGKEKVQLIGLDKPLAGSVLGGEAQLDLQYITAMAANVTTWFWSVPGTELATAQEPFLDWLMQVADSDDQTMPLVHSVSYGDDEKAMPVWFKRRVNEEFMKLALRGVSVLVAAGDDGASGVRARTDPAACENASPEFPASSPWVTTVGGTQFAKAASPVCGYTSDTVIVNCQDEGEVACTSAKGGGITSGGGFSSDFRRPWYQEQEVEAYLRQTDSPVPPIGGAWSFNSTGRAYPDISAVASNYLIWMGDHLEPTSGTSASTPLAAAMVAHLNELRLQRDLPPLGFLNPVLYKLAREHPEAFNDIVMGDNRCSTVRCCEIGFGAARGWDAVTGFGSPNFGDMMRLLEPKGRSEAALSPIVAPVLAESRSPAPASPAVVLALMLGAATFGAVANGVFCQRRKTRLEPLRAPLSGDSAAYL